MNISFPYRISGDGRTAAATDADHVREMIELLLFTHAGERVMRPDFGTGLLQFVFRRQQLRTRSGFAVDRERRSFPVPRRRDRCG